MSGRLKWAVALAVVSCFVFTPQAIGSSMTLGLSTEYDDGVDSTVAVNAQGVVVEVHKSVFADDLWYIVGTVDPESQSIDWEPWHL